MNHRGEWRATTHDWSSDVDHAHLQHIREHAATYGGIDHLLLEVLAHPVDEAESTGIKGSVMIITHPDGSISLADNGRGTDTRFDGNGLAVRKPIMSTADVRYFDREPPVLLADGRPRRGMSAVGALSTWAVHTNGRTEGAWSQRYEHGVPVGELVHGRARGRTGTTIHFLPDDQLVADIVPDLDKIAEWGTELGLSMHIHRS
ncbi:hypothetical protein ACQBAR_05125 [Propionibacteriaceae bacterium Y1685]|uniref:hypothetical protein n=1 Tax=Microlunatus sp. Y1700 TaxID=3418487 RepID=UPI003B7793EE